MILALRAGKLRDPRDEDLQRMKREPHPFARFINILGRGKTLTRSLTIEEAEEAMAMILAGETLPEQLGAFLMLLRVKEESPAEIAGFVRAARAAITKPAGAPRIDLDWSSYAGKGRQLPWFILSAQILARNGWRVFMHGAEAHAEGRVYTGAALRALGLPVSRSLEEAADQLAAFNFAYLPIDVLGPRVADMLELRPILGLRSPVPQPSPECSILLLRHACCRACFIRHTCRFTVGPGCCWVSRASRSSAAKAARLSAAPTSLAT